MRGSGDTIRVILADHPVVRAGLRAVLARACDIEVVAEANTGREAVALTERLTPDVLVIDLDMAGAHGAAATRELAAKGLSNRVLILTVESEEEDLVPLIALGIGGFLVKSAAHRELVDVLRAVAHGDAYLHTAAARVLARTLTNDPAALERWRYRRLTPRERDVLHLVADGYSTHEICDMLAISHTAVDTYKQRIEEKLGLALGAEYVQLALRLGILSDNHGPGEIAAPLQRS